MSIPYVYLLGWSKQKIYYYGARYAKGCHPNDLWIKYFTSSKYVKYAVEFFGEPDIIEIRKTFNDVNSCRNWEHKVLRRMKVTKRKDFLNKTDNKSITPGLNTPRKWTKEEKQKMSIEQRERGGYGPKIHSDETKEKMKIKRAGRKPALGSKWTEEQKIRHSDRLTGVQSSGKFKNGEIYVRKDNKNKRINPIELDKYLNLGWERGIVRDNSYLLKLNKDPEIIKKRVKSNTGQKRSEETKRKISEARIRYHSNRRNKLDGN